MAQIDISPRKSVAVSGMTLLTMSGEDVRDAESALASIALIISDPKV